MFALRAPVPEADYYFVLHGPRFMADVGALSPLYIGEGEAMLAQPSGCILGPEWAADLRRVAAVLDEHPDHRLMDQHFTAALEWLDRNDRGGAPQLTREAFWFYQEAFGTLCPELYPSLLALRHAETLLYAEPQEKPYREHLAHPIFVFLAGRRILDHPLNIDEFGQRMFDRLMHDQAAVRAMLGRITWPGELHISQDAPGKKDRSAANAPRKDPSPLLASWEGLATNSVRRARVIRLAWIVAALFHDLSYPLTHAAGRAHRARNKVTPLRSVPDWCASPELSKFLEGSLFYSDLRNRHQEYTKPEDICKELARGVLKNHSFGSALMVLSTLHTMLERLPHDTRYADDVLELVVAWDLAADAIALHDIESPQKAGNLNEYVAYDTNPLAWLLRTVDLLQEWDRPVREPRTGDYHVPFHGVAIGVACPSGASRVVNVHRITRIGPPDSISTPCPTPGLCSACWPGWWNTYDKPRPAPTCDGRRAQERELFRLASSPPLACFEVVCDGQPSPPGLPDAGWVQLLPSSRHERWYGHFWPNAVQGFLNTGRNAARLGELLSRLIM